MTKAQTASNYFDVNKNSLTYDESYSILDFIDSVDPDGTSEELFHEIVDTGRWESHEFTVFKFSDDSLLGVEHSEGLTEYQDSTGVTDVYVVNEVEVMTKQYVKAV